MRFSVAAALLLSSLLAACALKPPVIDDPQLRHDAPLATDVATDKGVDGIQPGAWPAVDWWKRYQDPTLNNLIDIAIKDAPSLKTANARYSSARESVRVTGAAQGIRVDANATTQRQRLSDNGLFPPKLLGFNWYNQSDLAFSASYTFDWWGKQRATIVAAVNEAHAVEAEQRAAALLLAGMIADNYFGWQADQSRLALARERVAILEHQLAIANLRIDAEIDSPDARQLVKQSLAVARSDSAALQGSAKLHVIALVALLGRAPNELPTFTAHPLPAVTESFPSNARLDLIARRPDIAASRWRVEVARKNLVVARADYFPDVSIHALAGLSSIDINNLLKYGSRVPSVGLAIHLPIFDSGLEAAQFGARHAQVDAAVANYDETVIGAAREVASAAANLEQVSTQLQQHDLQLAASIELQRSAAARASAGITDIRPRLSADLSLLAERDAATQLNQAALSADIALQRALGGGYEFKEESK